jgi:hypothetical protein
LYDRFAAPIEERYSQEELARWFKAAGLQGIGLVAHRGWLAFGTKPARVNEASYALTSTGGVG